MELMYEGIGLFFFFAGCVLAFWGRAFVIKYERDNNISPNDKKESELTEQEIMIAIINFAEHTEGKNFPKIFPHEFRQLAQAIHISKKGKK